MPTAFRLSILFLAGSTLSVWAQIKAPEKTPLTEPRKRLMKGNTAEARAAYEAAGKDTKYAAAAAIGIATAWREEGDTAAAIKALTTALATAPKDANLLAARADAYYSIGQWTEALADAAAARAIEDNHIAARWVNARHLRDSGKLDEADAAMRWFVRAYTNGSSADKDITDPDTLLIIGQAGAENARWHNISKQFSFIINDVYGDALKFEPDFWPAEFMIGVMLLEKYNRPDAVDAFSKALQINPNAAAAYVGKGHAALSKYEMKEADAFATEALKRNPKLVAALVLKADIEIISGDYAAAEKHLTTARAINPRDEVVLGKLGGVLTLLKKIDIAATIAKEVDSFDAKPGVFHHEQAAVLEQRKQYAKAEAGYLKAAELRPRYAEPRTALGMLYLRMGREDEGRKLLDAAFAADKFNVKVANSRKVLDVLDRYATITTPHYTVKYDATKDRILAEFLAESLEAAHADLKRQFQYEPPERVPFQVFSRHDMFSGRTIGLPDLHTVGASTGRIVAMASPHAQGVPKPFNWGRVVRHELTHIFNLTQTNQQCPHWLTEGLAVRSENAARPYAWLKTLRDFSEAEELFTLDTIMIGFAKPKTPAHWTLAYCQANLYVEHLIAVGGEAAVAKILKAYGEGLDTAAAIRQATALTKDEFEAGYRKLLKATLKPFVRRGRGPDPTAKMTTDDLVAEVDKNPTNYDAKARLAERRWEEDKLADARRLADEVVEKRKGQPVAAVVKARLLMAAGDVEEARVVLDEAVTANADDARLLLLLTRVSLETGNAEAAIAALETGRKRLPLDADWNVQLAKLYEDAGETDKQLEALKSIAAHDGDDVASRVKLATVCLENKDAKQALAYAREAIEIDVQSGEAQKVYLDALTATGDTDAVAKMKKRFANQ